MLLNLKNLSSSLTNDSQKLNYQTQIVSFVKEGKKCLQMEIIKLLQVNSRSYELKRFK